MLANAALQSLQRDLTAAIGAMGLHAGDIGKPALVETQAKEAEKAFQGYARAKPNREDAYAAARSLLRGESLTPWQQDMVASALAEPIREQRGMTVMASERLGDLLAAYDRELRQGELWRLTWHGLLSSYFGVSPSNATDTSIRTGWSTLRAFLSRTWPLLDQQAGNGPVPDWIQILRQETEVLSPDPAKKYAEKYLQGDTSAVDALADNLGIAPSSWFWHSLVLSAVKHAITQSDEAFKQHVPSLIRLIDGKPGFRDEAIELILGRYHRCKDSPPHQQLSDYVCQSSVWKNPKLKSAGIAPAWNRVSDPVWMMVLRWVNDRSLRDFFDILAARNNADEGRLAFWSKYMDQIQWTRLVLGADTMALQRSNPDVRELIAREQGSYARLLSKPEVDAFMMQLGSHVIIEFSKKPNACYVYVADQLPFEPYDKSYLGTTADLAAGFKSEVSCALRIVHNKGWAEKAEAELRALGIFPDRPSRTRVRNQVSAPTTESSASTTSSTAASKLLQTSSSLDVAQLESLLSRFRGATFDDKREKLGGRLWVDDPLQRVQLATELKALGFKWANSRQAWYYAET